MFCSKCGAPNDDSAEYCGNCGAELDVGDRPAAEPLAPIENVVDAATEPEVSELPAGVPADLVEGEVVVPPAIESGHVIGAEQRAPEPLAMPVAAAAKGKPDSNTAFLIEFLGGIFGFLGLGYIYACQTNDGVVRLVVWLVYTVLAWVVIALLSAVLVGVCCIPFQLAIQIGVPLWSANGLKKQLLAMG